MDIVRGFFKGVHISLHARTDEDVEPDVVLGMVGKAIAGEGIKLVPSTDESDSMNDTGSHPIGSNYKRVNPQEEINAKAKDDFWRKDQAEEERRRREEKGLERKFSQAEVKLLRRESQDYFEREEEAEKIASPKPQINGGTTITTNGGGSGINKSNSVSPTPPTAPSVRGMHNKYDKIYMHNPHSIYKMRSSHVGFTSSPSSGGVGAERTAALQASMPMKKNNSDLVRSRIKSFDGGSSGPVFPSSTTTTPPRMSNGINSINKMASISGGKSPSPVVSSSTPPPAAPVNGDSLSVLKRKQLFESGKSPSSENSSNTITRRNPADEIRLMQEEAAKKLEEEKKKKQQEKKKEQPITTSQPEVTKPTVVASSNNDYENNYDEDHNNKRNVTSPTVHFQSPPLPVSPPPAQQQPAFFNNPGVVSPTKTSISPAPVVEKVPSPTPPSPTPPPPQQFQNAKEDHVPIREDNTVRSAAHEQHNGGRNTASSPSPIPPSPVPATNSYTNGGDSSSIISINITPEMGVCARALYDYQAGGYYPLYLII